MSWMSQLYKTYERNIGKGQQDDVPLTPVAHMNANAQIEITLNREGEFLAAEIVDKKDSATLIPVTESSAGRSSGVAPHALCDMLPYIAGDFHVYCDNEKQQKSAKEKFRAFCENLGKWAESEESHPKVRAIYHYISRETMAEDLVKAGLVELTAEGTFEKKKISGQDRKSVV